MKGHITLKTTFDLDARTRIIKVNYPIVNTLSPYNAIRGWPPINLLVEVLSTLHMSLKYPLPDERVGVVHMDQEVSQKCYQNSLEMIKEHIVANGAS